MLRGVVVSGLFQWQTAGQLSALPPPSLPRSGRFPVTAMDVSPVGVLVDDLWPVGTTPVGGSVTWLAVVIR